MAGRVAPPYGGDRDFLPEIEIHESIAATRCPPLCVINYIPHAIDTDGVSRPLQNF